MYVMLDFGRKVHGNGGIWQVSKIAFMDTVDTRAHKRLPRKYDQVWTAFGRLESCGSQQALISTQHLLLDSSYLSNFPSCFYTTCKKIIIEKLAEYWKIYYVGGNGYNDSSVC